MLTTREKTFANEEINMNLMKNIFSENLIIKNNKIIKIINYISYK